MMMRAVVGLFLEAGSPCLSESSSELGLLEKIARPLFALTLWKPFNCRNYNVVLATEESGLAENNVFMISTEVHRILFLTLYTTGAKGGLTIGE